MRILVAFEECYQDVTADVIRTLRPHAEVLATELDALEAEAARTRPGLVICSRPKKNVMDGDGVPAWLKLPTGRDGSAELSLDGEYSEVENPGLVELLWVIDEAERLLQAKACPRNY